MIMTMIRGAVQLKTVPSLALTFCIKPTSLMGRSVEKKSTGPSVPFSRYLATEAPKKDDVKSREITEALENLKYVKEQVGKSSFNELFKILGLPTDEVGSNASSWEAVKKKPDPLKRR